MNVNNKLKSIIAENTISYNNNVSFSGSSDFKKSEESILSLLKVSASQSGVIFQSYNTGIATFYTYDKNSVINFTSTCDQNDDIEGYALSVSVTDPLSKSVSMTQDFDFEIEGESECIRFYIDVAINPQYIIMPDEYIDLDDDLSGGLSDDSIMVSDENEDDSFDLTESPLIMEISNTASYDNKGSFIASVHPKNKNELYVKVFYDIIADEECIENDLNTINNIMFNSRIKDTFDLISPAKCSVGERSSTSAVYKAKRKTNVLNIVECFNTELDKFHYNIALTEITKKIVVNYHGKKRMKISCGPGYKYNHDRGVCTKIDGAELSLSRIAHRQAVRTKKSMGMSYQRRVSFRGNKAKHFRKLLGL